MNFSSNREASTAAIQTIAADVLADTQALGASAGAAASTSSIERPAQCEWEQWNQPSVRSPLGAKSTVDVSRAPASDV